MRSFPVGYRAFHADPAFNFPLNRWLPHWEEVEVAELSKSIAGLEDWRRTMHARARIAVSEDRLESAAFFFRAAEFYTDWEASEKHDLYRAFLENFYASVEGLPFQAHQVPFGADRLPALSFAGHDVGPDRPKTTLVIHGGFDSAMEEFFDMALGFAEVGHDVILFEGPGQGRVLHDPGLTMSPDWAAPTTAVLDHFGVESCSLFGISLGGCLALRAAAKEPRIERVILCDVLEDFFDCLSSRLPGPARRIIEGLLRAKATALVDHAMRRAGEKVPFTGWAIRHGMAVSGSRSPSDFLYWLGTMNTRDVSPAIDQDVLILAGAEDHLVPLAQLSSQAATLRGARSLTTRTFSRAEQAHNHCQIGNLNLMLEVVLDWLELQERVNPRPRPSAPAAS